MTWAKLITSVRRQARDESGASLIEYTVVISLFLLVYFAVLDFGRLGFNWVMTEKAMQRAPGDRYEDVALLVGETLGGGR